MKYLDDRERRLAIMAGPVLVGLNVALTFVTLHNNHRYIAGKLNKAYEAPSAILALGIGSAVVAGIVVVSAFFRRRSFTIFTLLFAGYGVRPRVRFSPPGVWRRGSSSASTACRRWCASRKAPPRARRCRAGRGATRSLNGSWPNIDQSPSGRACRRGCRS